MRRSAFRNFVLVIYDTLVEDLRFQCDIIVHTNMYSWAASWSSLQKWMAGWGFSFATCVLCSPVFVFCPSLASQSHSLANESHTGFRYQQTEHLFPSRNQDSYNAFLAWRWETPRSQKQTLDPVTSWTTCYRNLYMPSEDKYHTVSVKVHKWIA